MKEDSANISVDEVVVVEEVRIPPPLPLILRPPDGGWGWVIAVASFFLCCLIHILPYCFGILFSGFLLDNGASSTTTAWIYNLYIFVWFLSMSMTNPMCEEFGQRTIGFVGVSLATLSILLSGFAPSVPFLYFSFSVLGGVSTGVIVGIVFMSVPPYFDKRAGQANTFLVVGAPVTQLLLAPFLRFLLEEYSLKGASLITAGIMMNGFLSVALFHPVKWHLRAETKAETKTISDHDKDECQPLFKHGISTQAERKELQVHLTQQSTSQPEKETPNPLLDQFDSIQEEKNEFEPFSKPGNSTQAERNELQVPLTQQDTLQPENVTTNPTLNHGNLEGEKREFQPIFEPGNSTQTERNELQVPLTQQDTLQPERQTVNPILSHATQEEEDQLQALTHNSQMIPKKREKETLQSTFTCGSRVTSPASNPLPPPNENVSLNEKSGYVKVFYKALVRVIEKAKSDVRVLREFRAIIISVTIMLTQTTFLNFIMMIPFVALASGHGIQDGAQCISLLGLTNLITRLIASPLSDCKRFSIRVSVMMGYVLRASGIAVAGLSANWYWLMASGVIFGLGLGFSLGLLNPCIVHYMGLQYFKPTIGILGLVSAGGCITLGPLIGVIRDTTNSYPISLSILVSLDLLSVFLWVFMPRAQVRDVDRRKRREERLGEGMGSRK